MNIKTYKNERSPNFENDLRSLAEQFRNSIPEHFQHFIIKTIYIYTSMKVRKYYMYIHIG